MPPAGIVYRPKTDADRPFLQEVYASTRSEELAMVPWTSEQKAQFLEMQFNAQWSDYENNYPDADFFVIEKGGLRIGRIYVERGPEEICIIDIALLPAARGTGLGTHLMREILDEAQATRRRVTIYVERYNPALRLYRRLGFEPVEEGDIYFKMHWIPTGGVEIS